MLTTTTTQKTNKTNKPPMHHKETTEHCWNWWRPCTVERHMHSPASLLHLQQILASQTAWDLRLHTSCLILKGWILVYTFVRLTSQSLISISHIFDVSAIPPPVSEHPRQVRKQLREWRRLQQGVVKKQICGWRYQLFTKQQLCNQGKQDLFWAGFRISLFHKLEW